MWVNVHECIVGPCLGSLTMPSSGRPMVMSKTDSFRIGSGSKFSWTEAEFAEMATAMSTAVEKEVHFGWTLGCPMMVAEGQFSYEKWMASGKVGGAFLERRSNNGVLVHMFMVAPCDGECMLAVAKAVRAHLKTIDIELAPFPEGKGCQLSPWGDEITTRYQRIEYVPIPYDATSVLKKKFNCPSSIVDMTINYFHALVMRKDFYPNHPDPKGPMRQIIAIKTRGLYKHASGAPTKVPHLANVVEIPMPANIDPDVDYSQAKDVLLAIKEGVEGVKSLKIKPCFPGGLLTMVLATRGTLDGIGHNLLVANNRGFSDEAHAGKGECLGDVRIPPYEAYGPGWTLRVLDQKETIYKHHLTEAIQMKPADFQVVTDKVVEALTRA